jgi:hypothetical protein
MPITSWRPWLVHKDFEEKEAGDGGRRLTVPLGQRSGSHRRQGDRLDGRQGEEGAGRPHPHPKYVQERVGGGCPEYRGGRLCQGVPAIVSAS